MSELDASREAFEPVERLFRDQMAVQRLHPGASLAVWRRGRLILDLHAGLADTQQGTPVAPDTLFVLFSSTKPLASVAVLQLVERGLLDLDEPVVDVARQRRPVEAAGRNVLERLVMRNWW